MTPTQVLVVRSGGKWRPALATVVAAGDDITALVRRRRAMARDGLDEAAQALGYAE